MFFFVYLPDCKGPDLFPRNSEPGTRRSRRKELKKTKNILNILFCYTVTKGFWFPHPQPGCHYPNSTTGNNLIIPRQGEFDKWHPGWGRKNR
jgi:hypothetical protein